MSRGPAAIFAMCVIGVAMLSAVCSVDSREVNSEESKSEKTSDAERETDGPRAVVARWMDLVLADNIRDSWALTTKSKGLNADHDLPRLRNKDKVRIERSLGNDSVAVVVTNTVKHLGSGKDRAFAFWLVRRDGSWLINMSYIDDPKNIEEQLRGLFMGGGVKWHVTKDDLVGTWLAGPGAPGGVGGVACGSRFQLKDNGSFKLEMWGPDGPDETEVKRGTWRLEEDRIIREQDKQRLVSRISWIGSDSLILQPADRKWCGGKSGTHYRRETHATTSRRVRELAARAAQAEGYDLKNFAAPKISFDPKGKEWTLFFEGTLVPAPGNHFWVLVDSQTGKASVRHGE